MTLSPYPRSRTYGSPRIYGRILADTLRFRSHSGKDDIARLEDVFAAMQGARHALALSQGRLGIFLALAELIEPGQEVILSPYTIYDVVNMVLGAGGVPVFADVDPTTGNLCPASVQQGISASTGAVLATHIHGLSCEIEEIARICAEADIPLIEDCAQCLGAKIDGRAVGTFGDVGIFSFSRVKNVNTIYGGMLITSNTALSGRLRARLDDMQCEPLGRILKRTASTVLLDTMTAPLVFQGLTYPLVRLDTRKRSGVVDRITGAESAIERRDRIPEHYLRRISPMQARLALMQLSNVEADRQRRVSHARLYHEGLHGVSGIDLPPMHDDGRNTYLSYPIQSSARDDLVQHLVAKHRDVRVQYYHNLAACEAFADFRAHCPNTDRIATRTILLPIYPGYPEAEIHKTVEAIRSFDVVRRESATTAGHSSAITQ
ncbi:DegT/DnrJ/EryC1/StrS family aminotransferase [Tropicimonas marinistellae]|uniref:DegT/DnrJ/EryC1/StrS family aminotransferase n=1 Tax=Tropicimonas marinistellae TaxID=1739787 RepID=UPI00082B6FC0|nr:DegT/DnrJ/EryC1/StrS family aminotransferase [Tropicimonas marinistellae]